MHKIDCHILTLPTDCAQWAADLRADLDTEPVHQHWLPGIPGQLGAARSAGYARGTAEYVTRVDPDDRVLPGTFAALLAALQVHPAAPFAWCSKLAVDEHLSPCSGPAHVPEKYNPRTHRNRMGHVHGVVLYRRAAVAPVLETLRKANGQADYLLTLMTAMPRDDMPPGSHPVCVPTVGLLWRQHSGNYSKRVTAADMHQARQLSGITTQFLRVHPSTERATDPM